MNKWLLTEQLLKKIGPLQQPESILSRDLKNADEPLVRSVDISDKGVEVRIPEKRGGGHFASGFLFYLAWAGLAAFLLISLFLFSKVHSLKDQNSSLLAEYKELQRQIGTLQERNRSLTNKIDKAEQERAFLKSSIDTLKKERESLKENLSKATQQATGASDEKTYLEEMLINKTKEIESLKKASMTTPVVVPTAAVGAGQPQTIQDLTQQLRQKDEEIQRLSEQNKVLTNKLDKLYKAANDKIAAINVAKITLEDTITEARKIIDNEFNAVDLGSIKVDRAGSSPAAPQATPSDRTTQETRTGLRKEGRVLAMNEEHGFVVVDLGKVNGITGDTTLTVKQNGQTIATLSVLEIRDVMTACNIKEVKPGKTIAVNDPVLLQL